MELFRSIVWVCLGLVMLATAILNDLSESYPDLNLDPEWVMVRMQMQELEQRMLDSSVEEESAIRAEHKALIERWANRQRN